MPADRIPTTPEQWDDISQERVHADYELCQSWRTISEGAPHNWLDLAAASRIAEHERCVERLAAWLKSCGHCYDDGPIVDAYVAAEARRILEDR